MTIIQRQRSQRISRNNPPVSPSEFFRNAPIQKSRAKRYRLAFKNWLNGLPTIPDEDALRGIESEHAITEPIDDALRRGSVRVKRKRDYFKLKWRKKLKKAPIVEEAVLVAEEQTVDSSESSIIKKEDSLKKDQKHDRIPIRIIQVPPPSHLHRHLWPSGGDQQHRKGDDVNPYAISNRIKTAKYSLLTFLPKNLMEQFRRVANVYFLFIIILQAIPVISNYNVGLAAMPLIIIVSITAAKDALEDWKRYSQDKEVNFSWTRTLRHPELVPLPSDLEDKKRPWWKIWMKKEPLNEESLSHLPIDKIEWERRYWQDVRVGDILYLENNEMIPADILILSTSEPDSVCYVETKNLDGETNLKVKHGADETAWIQSADDAAEFKAQFEVEMPSSNLYTFYGRMMISRRPTCQQQESQSSKELCSESGSFCEVQEANDVIPLDANNLLLRGCVLRNTNYVIGVVVYTGNHTKLMLNSGGTPSKRSRIERQMNPQIILNFALLFLICLVCAVVQGILAAGMMSNAPYWVSSFTGGYSGSMAGFLTFWSSVILFQTLVPISLYLTVELCKTAQAFLIHSDIEMWHRETDTVCVPRAWNLSDDLGQIQYLFSDKTGTLTRNIMEFRRVSIAGKVYGFLVNGQGAANDEKVCKDKFDELEDEMNQLIAGHAEYSYIPPSKHAFVDPRLIRDLFEDSDLSKSIIDFFTLLTVCHTVLIERVDGQPHLNDTSEQLAPHQLIYKAQSPDEAALVSTSRDLGFVFLGREQDKIHVSIPGQGVETIKILNVIEFNSTRKRMSVVISREDGRILLLSKGADNIIFDRLAADEAEGNLGRTTLAHLEKFAEDGLRTLCLAQRELPKYEYEEWQERFENASSAIHDREVLIDAVCDELEKGFKLLGATAIEDRLQEGVPECIEKLQMAGIHVWVLTGDKLETAINIGFSCKLLRKEMLLLTVRSTDVIATREQLRAAYEQIWKHYLGLEDPSVTQPRKLDEWPKAAQFALIIEGTSLKHAFDPSCRKLFIDLASRCTAVICCRVSPLQKAKVVQLMKRGKNVMTMAIGDGANDVSMIQAADVGVGISGQEGMQAVMASDYALGQFRYLTRLLIVHGRWSYIRTAEVTLASFYKNILFVVLLFWYQFYCGFTAEYVYDYMFLLFFNLLFSVAPLLVLGVLDRDLEARTLIDVPPIYSLGIRQKSYSMKLFGLYVMDALYQSMICFWIPMSAYADVGLVEAGYVENKALLGNVMSLAVIMTVNLYVVINTFSWTVFTFIALPLALIVPIIFLCVYSLFPSQDLYGTWRVLLQPLFWATITLTVLLALAPRILIKYIQSQTSPTDLDICREVTKYAGEEGETRLVRSLKSSLTGSGNDFSQSPMEFSPIVSPPKVLHREGSKELQIDEATPSESVTPSSPPLYRVPSSSALLRQRLVPLGSVRSASLRVFNLRTGRFERINGFAYSQDEGMRGLIEGRARPANSNPRISIDYRSLPGYRSPTAPQPSADPTKN